MLDCVLDEAGFLDMVGVKLSGVDPGSCTAPDVSYKGALV